MKTFWNSAQTIEQYLEGKLTPVNRLLFLARLKVSPDLQRDLEIQKQTYWLVKVYHRKKLREELEYMHQHLMGNPEKIAFQRKIWRIFGGMI